MPEKITFSTLRLLTVFCSGTLKSVMPASAFGAIGASTLRIRSAPRLRTTRNRADSGSQTISTNPSRRGRIPPSISRLCQPMLGISLADTKPPQAMPRLKPQNMLVTSNDLSRSGVYSDSNVVALGIAAPSPSPVNRRRTSN